MNSHDDPGLTAEFTWRRNDYVAYSTVTPDRARAEKNAAVARAASPEEDIAVVSRLVSAWSDVHDETGLYTACPVCGMRFPEPADHAAHLRQAHPVPASAGEVALVDQHLPGCPRAFEDEGTCRCDDAEGA